MQTSHLIDGKDQEPRRDGKPVRPRFITAGARRYKYEEGNIKQKKSRPPGRQIILFIEIE